MAMCHSRKFLAVIFDNIAKRDGYLRRNKNIAQRGFVSEVQSN